MFWFKSIFKNSPLLAFAILWTCKHISVLILTAQEAVGMIKVIEDPEEGARRLMTEAYQRGSADNITCVVVRFFSDQTGGVGSSSNIDHSIVPDTRPGDSST